MYLGRVAELAERETHLPRPAPPVHAGPDVGHPACPIPTLAAQAHHPARRRAQPGQPPVGLPLPSALLAVRAAGRARELPHARSRSCARLPLDHRVACHFAERSTGDARGEQLARLSPADFAHSTVGFATRASSPTVSSPRPARRRLARARRAHARRGCSVLFVPRKADATPSPTPITVGPPVPRPRKPDCPTRSAAGRSRSSAWSPTPQAQTAQDARGPAPAGQVAGRPGR